MAKIQIPRPTIIVQEQTNEKRRLTHIVNEVTGHKGGVKIEHADGRVSGIATPPTVTRGFDVVGIDMSEYKKVQYGRLREIGHSHEAALLLLPKR